MNNLAAQNISLKTLHPKITHCCEAPIPMLYYYFDKKQVPRGTFGEIWQIKMYPQTYIEPNYGAFNLKNKVIAHGLVLLVQLT